MAKSMEQFHFNYKDITRVHRYGFSARRIGIHLTGILLAYLIYQSLVYLTLFVFDGSKVQETWTSHGLIPIIPSDDNTLSLIATVAMWFGITVFALIFFLTNTLASKITIEQLRGDSLYTIGNALSVLKARWKSVFGSFLGLLVLLLCLLLIPISIALLTTIPFLKETILTITSFFIPISFLFGALILFILTVCFSGLFLIPAAAATTNVDAFEIIYQLFSIVWNQPWRLLGYGVLLSVLKIVHVPIWAIFCIGGFFIVLLPTYYLHASFMQDALVYANKWLGGTLQKIYGVFFRGDSNVFEINTTQLPDLNLTTTICAIFITFTLLCIVGGIVAYLFSLASVGTTLIYVILRKHVDGENLLEPIAVVEQQPLLIGDE